jgi:hypothetical protein
MRERERHIQQDLQRISPVYVPGSMLFFHLTRGQVGEHMPLFLTDG